MFEIIFQFFVISTALTYSSCIINSVVEMNKSSLYFKEANLSINSVHLNTVMKIDSRSYGGIERLAKCLHRVNRVTFERKVGVFYQRNYTSQEILVTKYLQLISHNVDVLLYGNWTGESSNDSVIQNVVLFLHNLESFSEISKVFNKKTVDRKGKFVICMSSNLWTEERLVMLSKILWKSKVANAVIIVPDIRGQVRIYTYTPMEAKKCVPSKVFVLVDNCYDRNFTVHNLFMRKMKNMNQCKVVASSLSIGSATTVYVKNGTRMVTGFEGKVFNTIADKMNFTKEITPVPRSLWGDELPDGTWNGIHGNIMSGVADVGFCLMFPAATRLHFEEYSNAITTDRYIWVLPQPLPANWNKILLPFQSEVWLAAIAALIAAQCVMYIMARNSKEKRAVALNLWGISLGQSMLKTDSRGLVSFFLLCWTIYSFVLTNVYQSGLVGFLTSTSTAQRLRTVEDLLGSGIPFGGAQTPVQVYNNPEDPEDYRIYKNYQLIPLAKYLELFFAVMYGKVNFGTLVMESITYSFKFTESWYALKETALYYPSPFVFPKGSPYITEFNIQIIRLFEGGIINYWIHSNTTGTISSPGPFHIPLKVVHVLSVFIFWLIGISISILIFIGEILCNTRSENKKCEKMRKWNPRPLVGILTSQRQESAKAEIRSNLIRLPYPVANKDLLDCRSCRLPNAAKRLRTSSNGFESTRVNAHVN